MHIEVTIPWLILIVLAYLKVPGIIDWFVRRRHDLPSRKERAFLLGLNFMHQHQRTFDGLELSDLTGVTSGSLYHLLDRMMEMSYVRDEVHPDPDRDQDRRIYWVTANGGVFIQERLNKRPPRKSNR